MCGRCPFFKLKKNFIMEAKKYTLVRGRVVWDDLTEKAYNRASLTNEVGERLIETRPDVVLTVADYEKYGNPTTDEWALIREQLIVPKGFEGVLIHEGDSAEITNSHIMEWPKVREQLVVITEKEKEVEPKKNKRNAKVSGGAGSE